MEELKLLIEMVSTLPQMALWVLVGFFAYKVICVGSIYGIVRLGINKSHDAFVTWRRRDREVALVISGLSIDGLTEKQLLIQLQRLRHTSYVHESGAEFLKQALDDAFEKYGKENPHKVPKNTEG